MELAAGLSSLKDAVARNGLEATFEPAPQEELEEVAAGLSLPPGLVQWYREAAPVDFEIPWSVEWLALYNVGELVQCQIGYRWLDEAMQQVDDHWSQDWIVIGDCGADPIIVDISQPGEPVSMAVHGVGDWSPERISPTLGDFLALLAAWIHVCVGEFGGTIREESGELAEGFREQLLSRLGTIVPEPCRENLWHFIDG